MMTRFRVAASMLALVSMLAWGVAASAATSPRYVEGTDAAAPFFDPQQVVDIKMTMPQSSIDALWVDPKGEYMPGTITVRTKSQTVGPLNVGIRLKGGWGSFRNLDGKAAFKVKVNYGSASSQRLFGLKKLTLNNMVQDPGMIHEALAYRLFRNMGVAAPRVGYARVTLNGELYGLYANVETPDSVMLPRWFATTKHLYEGSYWTDVTPGRELDFEVDEGSSKDRSDLTALIAANQLDGQSWFDEISKIADLQQMVRMWAVEGYIGHWDGYSYTIKNNYYLHSDATGRFTMLPWGVDQTFDAQLDLLDTGDRGLMFLKCMAVRACRSLYGKALFDVRAKAKELRLDSMVSSLVATVRSDLGRDPRKESDLGWAQVVQQRTRVFLANRVQDVTWALTQFTPGKPQVRAQRSSTKVTLSMVTADDGALTTVGFAYAVSADGYTWGMTRKLKAGVATTQLTQGATLARYYRVQAVNNIGAVSEWSDPLYVAPWSP